MSAKYTVKTVPWETGPEPKVEAFRFPPDEGVIRTHTRAEVAEVYRQCVPYMDAAGVVAQLPVELEGAVISLVAPRRRRTKPKEGELDPLTVVMISEMSDERVLNLVAVTEWLGFSKQTLYERIPSRAKKGQGHIFYEPETRPNFGKKKNMPCYAGFHVRLMLMAELGIFTLDQCFAIYQAWKNGRKAWANKAVKMLRMPRD